MASARRIFISYRREDSQDITARLHEALLTRFGTESVFLDTDSIEGGDDWRKKVAMVIENCSVGLIVIGRSWLDVQSSDAGEKGLSRRLDEPGDPVRIEIECFLANPQVRIVPVLVHGATMPSGARLPASIAAIADKHALQVRSDQHFRDDARRLLEDLAPLLPRRTWFADRSPTRLQSVGWQTWGKWLCVGLLIVLGMLLVDRGLRWRDNRPVNAGGICWGFGAILVTWPMLARSELLRKTYSPNGCVVVQTALGFCIACLGLMLGSCLTGDPQFSPAAPTVATSVRSLARLLRMDLPVPPGNPAEGGLPIRYCSNEHDWRGAWYETFPDLSNSPANSNALDPEFDPFATLLTYPVWLEPSGWQSIRSSKIRGIRIITGRFGHREWHVRTDDGYIPLELPSHEKLQEFCRDRHDVMQTMNSTWINITNPLVGVAVILLWGVACLISFKLIGGAWWGHWRGVAVCFAAELALIVLLAFVFRDRLDPERWRIAPRGEASHAVDRFVPVADADILPS
jgi:hypothetical protein